VPESASVTIPKYERIVRENPPLQLHVVKIDLRNPEISIHVSRGGPDPDGSGPWTTKLETVRAMADRDNLDIAVNGDYFYNRDTKQVFGQLIKYPLGSPASLVGTAMTDGVLWSMGGDGGTGGARGSLAVDDKGHVRIETFKRFPSGTRQIISGDLILTRGVPNITKKEPPAPRTAVGVDRNGTTLFLVVVDGRRPDFSAGLSRNEMASELIRLGCFSALGLDGGGSTTLVMRDPHGSLQVLNRPSDGYQLPIPLSIERPVASALGFRLKRPPATNSTGRP
jgi:exopolysaccharide biosynthesis protein